MQEEVNISGIKFLEKKESVPYHKRITYKSTVLLLILLKCCRGKGCSLAKFQIIMNYAYSIQKQEELLEFIKTGNSFVYLRYDSTVVRTLEIMIADQLIGLQENGSFKLKDKGRKLAEIVWENSNIFSMEKKFLENIGSSLTERKVVEITKNLFNI